MKEKGNFIERMPYFFRLLFCIYIVLAILCSFVFDDPDSYRAFAPLSCSNSVVILPTLLLLAGALFFTLREGRARRRSMSDRRFYLVISAVFIAVFAAQLFIVDHIWINTGWDVRTIMDSAYELVNLPELSESSLYYLSVYPNNLIIVYISALMLKLGMIAFPHNPYLFSFICSAFSVCVSVYLAVLCVYKLSGSRRITVVSILAAVPLIALSPWIIIPYTDTFGMLFPSAVLFCLVFCRKKYLKLGIAAALCALGYQIKPTNIIPLIALILVGGCYLLGDAVRHSPWLRRAGAAALALLLGAGIAFGTGALIKADDAIELDPDVKTPLSHFLNMGFNTYTHGMFCYEDVVFSASFPDVQSRSQANFDSFKARMSEMGITGLARHFAQKTVANYNDGTFSWGHEGGFYDYVPPERNSLDSALRGFYYNHGSNYSSFAFIEQCLWLLVLICLCLNALPGGGKSADYVSMCLMGQSLFLLLFECRARYLYMFSPLFVVLACLGLKNAAGLITRLAARHKEKASHG